jgi:hypothetical protein
MPRATKFAKRTKPLRRIVPDVGRGGTGRCGFDRLCAAGAKLRDVEIGAIAFATADD